MASYIAPPPPPPPIYPGPAFRALQGQMPIIYEPSQPAVGIPYSSGPVPVQPTFMYAGQPQAMYMAVRTNEASTNELSPLLIWAVGMN